jgi:hypothetical protein
MTRQLHRENLDTLFKNITIVLLSYFLFHLEQLPQWRQVFIFSKHTSMPSTIKSRYSPSIETWKLCIFRYGFVNLESAIHLQFSHLSDIIRTTAVDDVEIPRT